MFEEEKTLTLRKPIVIGSGETAITYTELTLREPKGGEIAKAQHGAPTGTDVTLNLITLVCKIPRKAADEICQRDLREAADFFGQE